jgi:antitoxin component of RelBE/YafQ-DinJ toxin-antitoxin module
MTLEIGYHVMSTDAIEEHGTFDDELSIVEFLRRIERTEELPLDVTVTGLDDYIEASDDSERAAKFIHEVLRDHVNFILNQSPVVQFVVKDVEHWDGGVLPINGSNIRLITIFGGSFDQEGPGWYAGEFNVQS